MSEMPPSSYTPPPPPPPPAGGTGGGSSDRGVMIFLSYFGLLALIPMLTKKDDPDLQWHSKNGLALAIAYIPIWVIVLVLGFVLPGALKLLLLPINCGFPLLWLIVDIMAMVKAFGGQRMRIPVVTDMAEKMFGT
jgi:uncharacterized membrane protein